MSVFHALNENNEVFRGYITWGGLLIVKMLLMSILTVFQRFFKGAYENPEDLAQGGAKSEIKKDENVERVRRAHANDLENIPAFLIAALMYVMTEPQPDVGLWLIRIAAIARILHTIVYAIYPIRQPSRLICFGTCLLITIFMAVWSMVHFFHI